MRVWPILVVVAGVAIIAVAGQGRSPELPAATTRPVLAVLDDRLVRLDPRSLRPLPGSRARLREPIDGWAQAPDGSGLVVASGRGSRLRFFDVARMRAVGDLSSTARGSVAAVAWPRRERVWLVVATPGCCATGTTTVIAVDPIRRRVVARRDFDAGLARVAATPDGVVLLLAPSSTIGTATLATVDDQGRTGSVSLDVSAGLLPTEGVPFILRARQPGLAVDPRRRRAYVLPDRPLVVEVGLDRWEVRHHPITPARSLLDRLHDLIEPRAEAQQAVGPVRTARWLPPGLIAVAGSDSHVSWRADGAVEQVTRPAGLRLIDPRQWQAVTLNEHAARFQVGHGLLLADGDGLSAYRASGDQAFRVLAGRRVELLTTTGSLAYVRDRHLVHVVDLDTGRVVGSGDRPQLLLEPTPGPWG
jgi:hypothetical protein